MAAPPPRPVFREQPRLIRGLLSQPTPVLEELRARFGPVVGLGFGPARMAVVGDAAAIRELFALGSDSFRWGHKFNALGFVVGDESMIVSDGADHRRRRGSVQMAFSRRSLNGWIPMIVEKADLAVDEIGQDPSIIDLYAFGRRLVLTIVVRALFGDRLAERADEIGDLFQRPQDYLEAPAWKQTPHPFPRTARARVRADRRALDSIVDEQIAHLRANPSDDPRDVLAKLVGDGDLSDSEIRDQVVSLMGAGYDTTSATLAWMIWRVSLSPGLWGRLRAEADEKFGPLNQELIPDEHTLRSLSLANATMRETTRLHPAGVISPREAVIDIEVANFQIRKGTLILWSAHLAGRDSNVWIDPLRFDPDRFSQLTEAQAVAAKASWVPFGGGARNCLGFALAEMELTLIISRLSQRLDITSDSATLPAPVGMVVNRPTGGAPMQVSLRR